MLRREAEGVRYEIWERYRIRTTPHQSTRSGCQLPQWGRRGRFAPECVPSTAHKIPRFGVQPRYRAG